MEMLVKAILLFVSAFFGYLVREYQNRVSPFAKILGITGNVSNQKREIEFDENLISDFNNRVFFTKIEGDVLLSDLSRGKKDILYFQNYYPEFIELSDSIIKGIDSDSDYNDSLIKLLNINYFYKVLRKLLYNNMIMCKKIVCDQSKIIVPFVRNKDDGGEVIFEFPNRRIRFGGDFDEYDYIYHLIEPLIIAISQDDRAFIKDLLTKFKQLLESTNNNLSYFYDQFDKTLDKHSQWFFLIYIANTSAKPFVLSNVGKLLVKNDKTKAKFNEECYLVNFGYNNKGNKVIKDCENDVVIKSGESNTFYIATKNTQNEMDSGLSLRDTFNKKTGKAQITFPIYKIGFFKKMNFKIKNISFTSTGLDI